VKKPYNERTDIEKIHSQWRKLDGLHSEEQWSAAIVRAATAAEIAATYSIRQEFKSAAPDLDAKFVDSLLVWSNGIEGKFNRLLLPMTKGSPKHAVFKSLKTIAEEINKERNSIVHRGHFMNVSEAAAVIKKTKKLIEKMLHLYDPAFQLADLKSRP
jgi:hypothetical protein